MTILRPLAAALLFSLTACTADSSEPDAVESTDSELRSVSFFQRSPMSGHRLESFRSVVDRCLQLFGGYGYMLEYPIARAYADARITTIYGGTTEIMKEIIGRSMGL